MARQQSIVQFTGSIGNLTFYKTKDGFMARQRTGGGLTRDKVDGDPKYARIAENRTEFGRLIQFSKILRKGLRELLVGRADRLMARRLSAKLMEVLRSDAINDRGERLIQSGDMNALAGFEFNQEGTVESSVKIVYTTALDRVTGVFSLDVPAFNPQKMILRPEGATHCKFTLTAFSLDIDDNSFLKSTTESPEIDLSTIQQDPIQIQTQLPPDLETQLMLLVGIEYYQKIANGKMYTLENGAYNGLVIQQVDQVGI